MKFKVDLSDTSIATSAELTVAVCMEYFFILLLSSYLYL